MIEVNRDTPLCAPLGEDYFKPGWHYIQATGIEDPIIVYWCEDAMWVSSLCYRPDSTYFSDYRGSRAAYAMGWRYLGPVPAWNGGAKEPAK